MADEGLVPVSGELPANLEIVPREPGVEVGVEVWCRGTTNALQLFALANITLTLALVAWKWLPLALVYWLVIKRLQRRRRRLLTIVGDRLHISDGSDVERRDIESIAVIGTINRELHIRAKGRTHRLTLGTAHAEYLARWLTAWWTRPGLPAPPPGGYWLP